MKGPTPIVLGNLTIHTYKQHFHAISKDHSTIKQTKKIQKDVINEQKYGTRAKNYNIKKICFEPLFESIERNV